MTPVCEFDADAELSSPAPSPSGTRAAWGVGDQVLSSLTNFGLVVVVARTVDSTEFGAFALAMVGYALALGIVRAMTVEPFAILHSASSTSGASEAVSRSTSAGIATAAIAAVVVFGLGLAVGGPTGRALAIVGMLLLPLLVQDVLRGLAIAAGRPRVALSSDAAWAVVQFGGMALVAGRLTLGSALGLWGLGAIAGLVVAAGLLRMIPVRWGVREWLHESRSLWGRLSVEFVAWNAGWQLSLLVIGAVAGLTAVGALRGALTLVGPLNVLFLAVPLVAVPELARSRAGHVALRRITGWLSIALAALAATWGTLVMLAPESWGRAVLGPTWGGARDVLPAIVLFTIATGLVLGSLTGLRVLGATRESLGARLATAGALLGGAAVAASWGVSQAAWTLAGANLVAAALWRVQLRRATQERERVG